jgi:endonuclease/exonuclease/phosphatase family metal-dependent hydrolase
LKRAAAGALAGVLLLVGWLARGYIGGAETAPGRQRPDLGPAFGSLEECRAAVAAGQRASRAPGTARLGSWNLHWFPDGKPGRGDGPGGTDLDWLACAIAWMSVDVLAVQEVKAHPRARQKAQELTAKLDQLTSGKWRLMLDDCPAASTQHVGFLFNEARVSARLEQTFAALNPHGQPCKDQLRPGFGAYFRFPGGLDLHAVSVHLKSGGERRSLELRTRSIQALGEVYETARAAQPDLDLLFLGDFNGMGCNHCSPELPAQAELESIAKAVQSSKLRLLPASTGCSHYFSGQGTLLDLAVISSSTAELPAGARTEISGACGALQCRKLGSARRPPVFEALSDHCPILLDLSDRDLD